MFQLQLLFYLVSILVLLEVSLRRVHTHRMGLFLFCFNPCFIGSISEAERKNCTRTEGRKVSILVLLEVSLRPGPGFCNFYGGLVSILVLLEVSLRHERIAQGLKVGKFQSLFYWKYL